MLRHLRGEPVMPTYTQPTAPVKDHLKIVELFETRTAEARRQVLLDSAARLRYAGWTVLEPTLEGSHV